MKKKDIKVQLQLSPQDQKELNYTSPDLDFEFESLMKREFVLPITDDFKNELIQAIKADVHIPDAYLNNYKAVFKEGIILVLCCS